MVEDWAPRWTGGGDPIGGLHMRYGFIVKGQVPDEVVDDLPGMSRAHHPTGGTSLYGPVRDESDVLSLLARLRDHGLPVVEFRPLPD